MRTSLTAPCVGAATHSKRTGRVTYYSVRPQGGRLCFHRDWHQHPLHPEYMYHARWRAEEDRRYVQNVVGTAKVGVLALTSLGECKAGYIRWSVDSLCAINNCRVEFHHMYSLVQCEAGLDSEFFEQNIAIQVLGMVGVGSRGQGISVNQRGGSFACFPPVPTKLRRTSCSGRGLFVPEALSTSNAML